MNKKIIAMLMTAAMTVTLITGCGAGTASSGKSNAIADGVLTIGTNAEFPPFEYVGDNGEPDGFDIALINAIGEKLGVEVEVENMEFDSLVSSIGSKIDVAIAGMTVTEERKQSVDFSDPYFDAVQHVLVPAGSDIKSYEDLEGKIIGCQLGTTGDFIVEEIEGAESHQYNKALQAVEDLVNGKLDAVIIDSNPAAVFTSNYPDKIRNLDGEDFGFEPEHYAIAMPKGDKALADAVNKAISELKADGTFDSLVEKYIQQ